MKLSLALKGCTLALLLSSLAACQKQAPTPPPAAPKLVSAEPTSFDAIAKHLDSGGGLYFYLSTENFLKSASDNLGEIVPTLLAMGKMDPAAKATAEAAWKSLAQLTAKSGLNEISGFGASSIALEPGYYQNKWMLHHYEGKGNGLIWQLHGSMPNALDWVPYLPAKTAAASSGNLKLAPIWNALNQEAATNADLKQGLDLATQQLQKATGLDLAALLASLGPNYSMVVTLDETRPTNLPGGPNGQPLTLPEPGLAICIQVQDDLLINRLDQALSTNPMVTKSQETEWSLRTLALPLPMPFLRPTVAWKKGLLVLTSSDLLLREMLDVKAGKKPGLAADPTFKKLMTGLPAAGCGFSYLAPSFQKTINDVQFKTMQKDQAMTDPAAQKLMQYNTQSLLQAGATCAVTEETPEGWIGTSHGGTGPDKMVAACAVAPAAILSAVAVPNFLRARARSEATVIQQEMRMLDAAIDQWALENNKPKGTQPTTDDLKPFIKTGTPLYNRLASNPGATSFPSSVQGFSIIIPRVGDKLSVPAGIIQKYRDTCPPDFWAPYNN